MLQLYIEIYNKNGRVEQKNLNLKPFYVNKLSKQDVNIKIKNNNIYYNIYQNNKMKIKGINIYCNIYQNNKV